MGNLQEISLEKRKIQEESVLAAPASRDCAFACSTERTVTEEHRANTEEHRANTEEHRANTEERRANTEEHRANTELTPRNTELTPRNTELTPRNKNLKDTLLPQNLVLRAIHVSKTPILTTEHPKSRVFLDFLRLGRFVLEFYSPGNQS